MSVDEEVTLARSSGGLRRQILVESGGNTRQIPRPRLPGETPLATLLTESGFIRQITVEQIFGIVLNEIATH
jgi:hypothetical protein